MSLDCLIGNYFVVPTATAITRGWKLCDNRMREYQKLRRHGLKLAFWPTVGGTGDFGADLDWDWIKSLEGKRIGELRVDEDINGQDNVRIIFFKSNITLDGDPFMRIWLLTTFQKKRQDFTNKEIRAFRAMRDLIVMRHYGGIPTA
jgi:hypothetical protein